MARFLRENWIWILAPVALVVGLVLFAVVTGGEGDSPFVYNIR